MLIYIEPLRPKVLLEVSNRYNRLGIEQAKHFSDLATTLSEIDEMSLKTRFFYSGGHVVEEERKTGLTNYTLQFHVFMCKDLTIT